LDLSFARSALAPFEDPFLGFESIRAYQFFFLAPSLGLLLIPLFWLLRMRRSAQGLLLPRRLVVGGLALAATLTLSLQFTIMMAPHVLHHYPYFLPLSLHLLAAIAIMTHDSKILRMLACANYLLFILLWIVFIMARTPVFSMGGLICALILLGVATLFVGKWAFSHVHAATLQQSTVGKVPPTDHFGIK
jgi:hypothetical protein